MQKKAWRIQNNGVKTRSVTSCLTHIDAGVAKLVDALDLGSSVLGRGGSSPSTRTIL